MLFLWIFSLILPAVYLIGGILEEKKPPKRNYFVGYRTERAMRTEESFAYANRRFGKLLKYCGIAALCLTLFFNLILPLRPAILVLIDIICASALLPFPIIKVEKELKQRF